MDQALMEELLAGGTLNHFVNASIVYTDGAFSWPYAVLSVPGGIPVTLAQGTFVSGVNSEGEAVEGAVMERTAQGKKSLKVQYVVGDVQEDYVKCQVGGNPNPVFRGCKYSTGRMLDSFLNLFSVMVSPL
jgi:hypothetical protein